MVEIKDRATQLHFPGKSGFPYLTEFQPIKTRLEAGDSALDVLGHLQQLRPGIEEVTFCMITEVEETGDLFPGPELVWKKTSSDMGSLAERVEHIGETLRSLPAWMKCTPTLASRVIHSEDNMGHPQLPLLDFPKSKGLKVDDVEFLVAGYTKYGGALLESSEAIHFVGFDLITERQRIAMLDKFEGIGVLDEKYRDLCAIHRYSISYFDISRNSGKKSALVARVIPPEWER